MQTEAKMWQMFREIKCKRYCVESSEAIALQSRVALGPDESQILHVEFLKLCDTCSVTMPPSNLWDTKCKPVLLLTVVLLVFVQLMTDVLFARNVKIIEVVNKTIIVRNARNNMNKLTWSISLIINSDGHIKAHVLRLPKIQQLINAKHDRIEAIANMALEM